LSPNKTVAQHAASLESTDQAVAIRLQPRASRDAIDGEREGCIAIRLKAPLVDGAANGALLRFVANHLGVAPRDVRLVRGHTSRHKWITVAGLAAQLVRQRLLSPPAR
jgi:hypothetical protein